MLAPPKARLVCSRAVAAADYMQCLEQFMQREGSRDLKALLASMEKEVSWKSAPRLSILCRYSDLYRSLFVEAPNTILSHSKLTAAIMGCHRERPCLFSHRAVSLEAAALSVAVRMGASKWRDLKKSDAARQVVMGKVRGHAWHSEHLALWSSEHSLSLQGVYFVLFTIPINLASCHNLVVVARSLR